MPSVSSGPVVVGAGTPSISVAGILTPCAPSSPFWDSIPPSRFRASGSWRFRGSGPDWSGIYAHERAVLAHNRLAIVDVENGAQPLRSPDGSHVLAVNGEIYNHRELEAGLARPYEFQTRSDCEVILALYAEQGSAFLDRLNGIFAFVLYDADSGTRSGLVRHLRSRAPSWPTTGSPSWMWKTGRTAPQPRVPTSWPSTERSRGLEAGLARPYEFQTRSDCEVILALYAEQGRHSWTV